ncbi:MAG: thermonuclease family protein [candidate division Zixibacteria bacterium]|nr:thermonuclease family protein [candidate division Zixibacteria bacterium]
MTRVIDGDTIVLSNGERVRYIGVDTPERDEPFYLIARKFNRDLVEGRQIRIELDIQERDRYGRLLGYVYVDTLFVNATLVRDGMAVVATYPPNVKYVSLFTSLQKQARSNGLGLWSKE